MAAMACAAASRVGIDSPVEDMNSPMLIAVARLDRISLLLMSGGCWLEPMSRRTRRQDERDSGFQINGMIVAETV
jgi:hypothetical protein